jgi:hypothetical protein
MKVEIRAEAALFPEKEYINGIAVAVRFSGKDSGHKQTVIRTSRRIRGIFVFSGSEL